VQVIRAALQDANPAFLAELGASAGDLADLVPEVSDRLPGMERSASLGDPAEARFRMFESIRQFLASLSRHRTLLVVFDNLHWADAPSLRLLEFLGPELVDSRILVVGTYRATELSRRHPLSNALGALARTPHFVRVNLGGLSAEEVQVFIAATGTTVPAGLATTLHDQTEGNPLFLREIVRFLEQRGALAAGSDGAEAVSPSAIRIPEGVTEVIGRLLDNMRPGLGHRPRLYLGGIDSRRIAVERRHAVGGAGRGGGGAYCRGDGARALPLRPQSDPRDAV